jgi:hypothetical protein
VQNLSARIADLKEAVLRFRNETEVALAANGFRLKIQTATQLSCLSLLAFEESQDNRMSEGPYRLQCSAGEQRFVVAMIGLQEIIYRQRNKNQAVNSAA